MSAPDALIGRPIRRREDVRLLTGAARYLDDLELEGALHLRLVRSPLPHGRVVGVEAPDGVLGESVLTAEHLGPTPPAVRARYQPSGRPMPDYPLLAHDRVRYVGEPVAAALADTPYEAEDVAEEVFLDIEELPPYLDVRGAAPEPPPLHDDYPDNVIFSVDLSEGDMERSRREADRTVRRSFRTRRHTGLPLETRGCMAVVEDDKLVLWSSSQMPHLLRTMVADVLGWEEERIRVVTPDIGGGFGIKAHMYPEEALVSLLAIETGRPVKWVEDRSESLLGGVHARDHVHELELDVLDDGTILGLRVEIAVDCGAYPVWPQSASLEAQMSARIFPGPYVIPAYSCSARSVATNKAPLGTYRGVARPSCAFTLERLIDEAARELGLSPVEMRLRNLVTEFPHTSPTGLEYDAGSYRECVEEAAALVGYEANRASRAEAPSGERLRGIGLACFVEQSAHVPPWARPESGVVLGPDRVDLVLAEDGSITVIAGVNSHGQGQETTLAQVVADGLGAPLEAVHVAYGDTATSPYSMGAIASRSAVVAGGAAAAAAQRLKERLLALGATEPFDIPALVREHPDDTDAAGRPLIKAHATYDGPDMGTFSNACHAAVVEIDPDTGQVQVERYVVVEDCGRVLNPLIVDGQIQGGVAQGIGSALCEELVYDENGQLITTTLMDYRLPSMLEVPDIETHHISTPGRTALGMKGMGESGAIGPMAAIGNAVADAVGPERAARVTEVPLLPDRVWRILEGVDDER